MLLRLTTIVVTFLIWTPAAYAWCWPVQGPVLKPFAYDEAHPYAAGQHRGVDIGADSAGSPVVAPAAGTVSFAGTVPTNGKSITIETADGYSVTLTHLGSIAVVKGAAVAEQDTVGTVGPSGTPEVDGPYVHLGIRVTSDPNGYVDPMGLLPAPSESGADDAGSTTSQPASPAATSTPPTRKPTSSATRRPRAGSSGRTGTDSRQDQARTHHHRRVQKPRSAARTTRSTSHAVQEREETQPRVERDSATVRTSSFRRPFAEPAISEARPSGYVHSRRVPSSPVPALLCNWASALFGLGAVLLARRRRRNGVSARVVRLPLPEDGTRRVSRAA